MFAKSIPKTLNFLILNNSKLFKITLNKNNFKQKKMGVLRLQLPTDPRWVNIVEKNIEEILTDHAWL